MGGVRGSDRFWRGGLMTVTTAYGVPQEDAGQSQGVGALPRIGPRARRRKILDLAVVVPGIARVRPYLGGTTTARSRRDSHLVKILKTETAEALADAT